MAPRSTRLRRLRIRRATHSVAVATVVLLIVGLAHVTFQKHVTLVVNGRPQAVSTTSASVHDLLMGEGISYAIEYGRWTMRPSTITPMVMYWPLSNGVGSPSKRTQK